MHSPNIKHKAKMMRLNGTSINDISTGLHISKSTVSFWCRDIVLNDVSINKIKTKGRAKSVKALLRYAEAKRKERVERYKKQNQQGAEIAGNISSRDILMVGFGLYWGEGYKGGGELGFTNSNPKIIKFYIKWLKIFDVYRKDLIFRLTINSIFASQEKNIKKYWVELLGVNFEQCSKTTIIKTKIKKGFTKDMSDYKGILRVKVRKGLALKNKILGAIEHIANN
jgi:hypothetical protein